MAASRPYSTPKLCPTDRLLASRSSDGRLPNSDYEPQVLYISRLLSFVQTLPQCRIYFKRNKRNFALLLTRDCNEPTFSPSFPQTR